METELLGWSGERCLPCEKEKGEDSLGLVVLEGERSLGVQVLPARLGGSLDGAIRDDHASPGAAVPHDPQRELADALHQIHVPLGEPEHAAVIVVEDHHRGQARGDQHGRLRRVAQSVDNDNVLFIQWSHENGSLDWWAFVGMGYLKLLCVGN